MLVRGKTYKKDVRQKLSNDRDRDNTGTINSAEDDRDVFTNEGLEVNDDITNNGDDVLEDGGDNLNGRVDRGQAVFKT